LVEERISLAVRVRTDLLRERLILAERGGGQVGGLAISEEHLAGVGDADAALHWRRFGVRDFRCRRFAGPETGLLKGVCDSARLSPVWRARCLSGELAGERTRDVDWAAASAAQPFRRSSASVERESSGRPDSQSRRCRR